MRSEQCNQNVHIEKQQTHHTSLISVQTGSAANRNIKEIKLFSATGRTVGSYPLTTSNGGLSRLPSAADQVLLG